MSKHPHIILDSNSVKTVAFQATGGGNSTIPETDRREHANLLRAQYEEALNLSLQELENTRNLDLPVADGVYLDFSVSSDISAESFHKLRGPRLMSIKNDSDSDVSKATVYLPNNRKQWLTNKLNSYEDNGRDAKFLNRISQISKAEIRDFFTLKEDLEKYEELSANTVLDVEVWISKDEAITYSPNDIIARLISIGAEIESSFIEFGTVSIILVRISKLNLMKLPSSIDLLGEVRLFRNAAILLKASLKEQREWMNLLNEDIEIGDNPINVGLIDAGIRSGNELLDPFIPTENHLYAVTDNPLDKSYVKHGVLMAGLILHGDLCDWIHSPQRHRVTSQLVSVKILSGDDEEQTLPDFFGAVMEDAISLTRNKGVIVNCSAIAGEQIADGKPTSWSSSIDEILFNGGESNNLLILAAGNVEETLGLHYPDFNISTPPRDPNQSWNAISVGAITRKCSIIDDDYRDKQPIAPQGLLSPYSPCSKDWALVKPDVVMEGGNAIDRKGIISSVPDELNMVSTTVKLTGEKFDAMCATSGASALVARLAAKIQYEHPNIGPLAIRGLLVHSAEWSEEMKAQFTFDGKLNKELLLHTVGYGEPNEDKAISSFNNSATFILEREFKPFELDEKQKLKSRSMDIIELPWPKELLEGMENIPVRLKVTLSYYIQPSPGSNQYKYESYALRFDVINQTETLEQFQQRVSHVSQGTDKSENDYTRWYIGIQNRDRGSIISDYIDTSAINLADCRYISVSARYGWWYKRKWRGENPKIKYALIVTIETPEQDIYSAIVNKIRQQVEVEVHL